MIIDSEFYGLEKIQDPADDSFNAPAQGTLQLEQYVAQPRSQVPFLADMWHLAHYSVAEQLIVLQKLPYNTAWYRDKFIGKTPSLFFIIEAGDMVLLTMTASIVEVLKQLDDKSVTEQIPQPPSKDEDSSASKEPSLADPAIGKSITHGQIIDIWKKYKDEQKSDCSLENLLRGATIYVPPPPPKPEPSDEYKALMARLRRDEEERSYERMLKAPPTRETFAQRFPTAPMTMADSFAEANKPTNKSDIGEEGINHGEIQQQVTLIVNFLVSIAGCAAAIWICAQWWSTTARLFLTLFGTITVAICEVAVYTAYSWRMAEGDKKQKNMKEVKDIVKTWVIGADEPTKEGYEPVLIQPKDDDTDPGLRKRTIVPS